MNLILIPRTCVLLKLVRTRVYSFLFSSSPSLSVPVSFLLKVTFAHVFFFLFRCSRFRSLFLPIFASFRLNSNSDIIKICLKIIHRATCNSLDSSFAHLSATYVKKKIYTSFDILFHHNFIANPIVVSASPLSLSQSHASTRVKFPRRRTSSFHFLSRIGRFINW